MARPEPCELRLEELNAALQERRAAWLQEFKATLAALARWRPDGERAAMSSSMFLPRARHRPRFIWRAAWRRRR
jgi:hypothetical protein